jgi:bacterioferritin-associated ferredoxin
MIVCSCNNVTAGALQEAIDTGCQTLPMLADRTHASTTCGACIPRLEQLLHIDRAPPRFATPALLAAVGALALLAVALVAGGRGLLTARWPRALPVWDQLWRQPAQQQLTGFVLLGLVALTLIYPLRGRLGLAPRRATSLRLVHAVLGTVALAAIVAHTGLRVGVNSNRLLSIAFLLLAGLGSLASFQRRQGAAAAPARGRWLRGVAALHGLLFWPALALIGVHILAVYYF